MSQNNKIDYEFELDDITDYTLYITLCVNSRTLNEIYQKARSKLNKNIPETPQDIKEFYLPLNYNNLVCIVIKNKIKEVINIVAKDKIIVLNYKVSLCKFVKKAEDWYINIKVVGQYADKR
jgi:hypothetical protein